MLRHILKRAKHSILAATRAAESCSPVWDGGRLAGCEPADSIRLGVGRYGESVPLLLIWPELSKENRALCGQERCLLGACPDRVTRPWIAARAGIRHTPQNTSPPGSRHPVASPPSGKGHRAEKVMD